MNPARHTRVKVCCIQSIEEARLAIEAGGTLLGLVGRMPSGFGPIDDERIQGVAAAVPPGVKIIQVVHVAGPASVDEACDAARGADALLLDSGRPDRMTKELGGTGRVHDWNLSRRIRERVEIPVFLAGGLNPENAAAAVREVRPYGIDACTGPRVDGRLDPERARAFVRASQVIENFS